MSAFARWLPGEELATNFPLSKMYEASAGSITIEDNVWLGMDALILGRVKIGKGAIIAARSVVTKDVEPFTNTGIPARLIGSVPI